MKRFDQNRNRIRDCSIAIVIILDICFFTIAQVLAYYVRIGSGWFDTWLITSEFHYTDYLSHFCFGVVLYVILATYRGLFLDEQLFRMRNIFLEMLKVSVYWFIIYLFISLVFKFDPPISRLYVGLAAVFSFPLLMGGRVLFANFMRSTPWIHQLKQRIIFVGWSGEIDPLVTAVREEVNHPYYIEGWVESPVQGDERCEHALPRLGSYSDLESIIHEQSPDIIILGSKDIGNENMDSLIHLCGQEGVGFKLGSSVFPVFTSGLRIQTISGVPLLGVVELAIEKWYNRLVKRMVDVVGALLGLVLFAPVIFIFAVLVYRESPGYVIYRQVRLGRWGVPFQILKIRSMKLDAEKNGVGWSEPGDTRRLKIGSFMRRWNIDELPQFWNVLKGEMSLVGPRPERPELIDDFKYKIKLYNVRHGVKPGLTGWAQVNGWRGDTDLTERIRHDLYYMENWSIWMDIQIMMMTFYRYKNAS
ncbi:MAG: sugar transferase [Verrucomicrobiota bacterium]